jgi:hypothetical protein
MHFVKSLVLCLLVLASTGALAIDPRDRGFLSKGMSEGEVILKIGKPDHEALVTAVKGKPEEKTWTYFPHFRDAQTITIITLREGVVTNIERKISR